MEILTANGGFCIGISRAYRGMDERARSDAPFAVAHQGSASAFDTLRRIEHRDPDLLARYSGLQKVQVVHDVDQLKAGDRLVLGFHGLPKETKADLAARGVDLLEDLICPFIAKLDRVVERLAGEGYDIAIVGAKGNHHCQMAEKFASAHGRRCYVIEKPEDIDALAEVQDQPVALVGQVTGNTAVFTAVVERIRTAETPIKVVKTMCSDSYGRQKTAAELARAADLVILIDDGGGAAQSLFEVCVGINPRIHRVRGNDDIRAGWFEGVGKTAIIGGILVPQWMIDGTARHVRALCQQPAALHTD
jgi:4-hydroxy-3-methylbut-2-enyl diphosphate reductase